jgi:pyruvate dehydrogenase E1 component alpha subunit
MGTNLQALYRLMLRSRRFEEAVTSLWEAGKISGEMHLGVGEEAVVAGVVAHLQDGDAMALDHRGTPPLVMRGVDLALLMKEFLGRADGLCKGMGGHMHLFSAQHLAASSGIVGSSGPLAAGFALAAQYLHPGNVSVAFFGDGASNQGMLLESFNLASAWQLPLIFVCKDNTWAITTQSLKVTGGSITDRARSFGLNAAEVDGSDVEAVYTTAGGMIERARDGDGPSFLLACCPRLEGHYLGDPLRRANMLELAGPLMAAFVAQPGASVAERAYSLGTLLSLVGKTTVDKNWRRHDPVVKARRKLQSQKSTLDILEKEVEAEIRLALETALKET